MLQSLPLRGLACSRTALPWALLLALVSLNLGLLSHAQVDVQAILNTGFTWDTQSWVDALHAKQPRMLLAKVWGHPGAGTNQSVPPGIPITVFTALSLERLGQLQGLCQSWPGPLVAAVWLPVTLPNDTEPVDKDYYHNLLHQSQEAAARPGRSRRKNIQTPSQGQPDRQGHDRKQQNNGKKTRRKKMEKQLRVQLRQLEQLQVLLEHLHRSQGKSTPPSQRRRGGRRLAGMPQEVPAHVQHQIDGAETAVEAMLSQLDKYQRLARPMQWFHDLYRSQGAPDSQRPHADPSSTNANSSTQASTQASASTTAGNTTAGNNTHWKSSFISRSNYLSQQRRSSLHASGAPWAGEELHSAGTLFAGAEALGRLPPCQLTVLLFVQAFRDPVQPLYLFPINSLRNYALAMAETPLVSMIDVDLTVNSRFALSLLTSPARVEELVRDAESGSLLVLPAFEAPLCKQAQCRDGVAAAKVALHSTKPQLNNLLQRGWIDTFHCTTGTHWIVDYKRWLLTPTAYEVRYARGAEPWVIGHKSLLPWYDTRYKGYGFNKQLQVLYAIGNMRLRLRVLPDAWLVHAPHRYTTVARAFKAKGLVADLGMNQEEGLDTDQAAADPSLVSLTATDGASAVQQQPSAAMQHTAVSEQADSLHTGVVTSSQAPALDLGTRQQRVLQVTAAAHAQSRLHDDLVSLYAKMFSDYMWPLGKHLMVSSLNRYPDGEHPYVDPVMKTLVSTSPWWNSAGANYTKRFHDGQPSAVRPAFLDPVPLPAWPVALVKQIRPQLELCSPKVFHTTRDQ